MQKPPVDFLAEALRAIEELDDVEIRCREFDSLDPSSPAAAENAVANRAGIDPAHDGKLYRWLQLRAV